VPTGAATEVAARGLGGLLGKSLIAVKDPTGDALLTIERDQGYVGLPTDGVECQHLTQTMSGLLGLATRGIPFGQSEMARRIARMTLREGA
jgi:hypothetical protein